MDKGLRQFFPPVKGLLMPRLPVVTRLLRVSRYACPQNAERLVSEKDNRQ